MSLVKLAARILFALLIVAPLWINSVNSHAQSKTTTQPAPTQATPTPAQTQSTPQIDATPKPQTTTPQKQADDEDVLSVETNLVNVLFNAVDKDRRFVTTLTREDVRVFENDVPQPVSHFERETDLPISLAVLIDLSGSQISTLPIEKEAAMGFLDSTLRTDRADTAAIISFTGEAVLEQDATKDRARLQSAIERLRIILPPKDKSQTSDTNEPTPGSNKPTVEDEKDSPLGWSSVWDAIWATANEVSAQAPAQTRRAIILLSDGDDTFSRLKRQDAVDAAVKANAVIYSIGVEPDCSGTDMDCKLDMKAMRKVSEATGGRAFFPRDEDELHAAFAQIQQELRTQYLVSYSPTNKAYDGSYRRIRIEIVNPSLRDQKIKLTYREGYFATPRSAPTQKHERPPQEKLRRPPGRSRKK